MRVKTITKRHGVLCLAMLAMLLAVGPLTRLDAQASGTITGTVLDVTGRPIPGAAVSLRNEAGGVPQLVTAGADGFNKRVGTMYNNNGTFNQAVAIDPFNVTNLFINYTFRGESSFRGTKIRFAINNLFNQQNIVGVVPFSTKSNVAAPGDTLTLLPARSISVTMTLGYAPKW